jgi:hypothetical protein
LDLGHGQGVQAFGVQAGDGVGIDIDIRDSVAFGGEAFAGRLPNDP